MKNSPKSAIRSANSPEELVSNLRDLLSEAEGLVGDAVGEGAADKLAALQEKWENAQERMADLYARAREKAISSAQQTDKMIRSHPYESLAITLGIGVLLGAIIRGCNRSS